MAGSPCEVEGPWRSFVGSRFRAWRRRTASDDRAQNGLDRQAAKHLGPGLRSAGNGRLLHAPTRTPPPRAERRCLPLPRRTATTAGTKCQDPFSWRGWIRLGREPWHMGRDPLT